LCRIPNWARKGLGFRGLEDDVSPGVAKIRTVNYTQIMSFVASRREFMHNPSLNYIWKKPATTSEKK
jgi:hypothetical protein